VVTGLETTSDTQASHQLRFIVGGRKVLKSHMKCRRGAEVWLACTQNGSGMHAGDLVVVSPDVGGVARARAFAKKLSDAPLAIVDKRRSAHNVSEVMNLIGDVKGKVAVLVDDMIDTAGTITNAANVLHQEGAKAVYACATHAVFSPPAVARLSSGVCPRRHARLCNLASLGTMAVGCRSFCTPDAAEHVWQCGCCNNWATMRTYRLAMDSPQSAQRPLLTSALLTHHLIVTAGVFNEVIITNTIPLAEDKCFPQLTVLSVANLLGENIWKIYNQNPGSH
jgi:orotate phosphoribosyltransferase